MNLCLKYKPTHYSNIVGNKKIYKKLLDDLKKSKYKGNYLLYGNFGTCKSTFVDILAKQKKIKIEKIHIDDITIDDSLLPIFRNTIIKKIIVIDNIDLTIKSIETKMKKIKKYINLNKNNLLFIIANENKNSVFKDIKIKKYKFKTVEENLIKIFIENILEKEKIKLSKKNKDYIIKKIIKNVIIIIINGKKK
jgi:DNA polymerase III gamma/tau subunit